MAALTEDEKFGRVELTSVTDGQTDWRTDRGNQDSIYLVLPQRREVIMTINVQNSSSRNLSRVGRTALTIFMCVEYAIVDKRPESSVAL